jgi:Arc/MetJ family transcription regulator
MRMTLNLPDELIAEAMKDSEVANKTALIVTALEEYVRKRKVERLIALKGKILFYDGFDPERLRDEGDRGDGLH